MRIYIRTYGCKVNQVESEELAARLVAEGHELVRDEARAELYVINSCTVTSEADAKVRKGVRRAASLPQVEQVLVTGCAAALHADELRALSEKVALLGRESSSGHSIGLPPQEPSTTSGFPSRSLKPTLRSASETLALSGDPAVGFPASAFSAENSPLDCFPGAPNPCMGPETAPAVGSLAAPDFHTRVPVKVQDGCENFCNYCIVPYARGACWSAPMGKLVKRVAALAAGGTQEIVLTGINIGRYHDPETDADLPALIRALHEQGGVHRIRLSSIEPPDVTDKLCELLAEGILCEHLHIPLQSGSDRVLKAMGRHYTVAEYAAALERVRAAAPQAAIATDVIVGYPVETDEDFEATYDFCQAEGFSKIHVFRFSSRAATPAADLAPLDPQVVVARAARLRGLSAELAARYARAQAGRTLEWMVEQVDPLTGQATLTSREHLSMRIFATDQACGDLLFLPFDMMKSMRGGSSATSVPSLSEV